ncbi:MAG TPA: hypothetical protein VGA86_02840 [Desulfatiglandales bacterium]
MGICQAVFETVTASDPQFTASVLARTVMLAELFLTGGIGICSYMALKKNQK